MPTVLSRPMTSLNHSYGYQWPTSGQAKDAGNLLAPRPKSNTQQANGQKNGARPNGAKPNNAKGGGGKSQVFNHAGDRDFRIVEGV